MKKLRKNTNIATNSIKAYACTCYCAKYGCGTSLDSGMRYESRGSETA